MVNTFYMAQIILLVFQFLSFITNNRSVQVLVESEIWDLIRTVCVETNKNKLSQIIYGKKCLLDKALDMKMLTKRQWGVFFVKIFCKKIQFSSDHFFSLHYCPHLFVKKQKYIIVVVLSQQLLYVLSCFTNFSCLI